MQSIDTYLKNLDLSDVEVKLYTTLLQVEPTSVRDLAEIVKMKRTTVYFYIDQLVEKGLLMKLVRGSKKLIAANEPESLKQLVDTKIEKAIAINEAFPAILETLKASLAHTYKETEAQITYANGQIKYLKGISGAKKVYDEAFKAKEFRSYVKIIEGGIDKVFTDNITIFNQALKKNPKLLMKEILYVHDSPIAINDAKAIAKNSRYDFKVMPKEMSLSSEDIIIYDGNVAIINYKDKISSVILQSIDHYNNSKELFDFIWSKLPTNIR